MRRSYPARFALLVAGTALTAVLLGSMMDLTFRLVRFRPVELRQETAAETVRVLLHRS